jgi:SAM-dependent methyltransferase
MALANNSDKDWEIFGKTDPYFAVLTDPKFLIENLDESSIQSFFESGNQHIEHVYQLVRATIQPDFHPERVLDYGCGVGRLVVALAQRARSVVGIDISPSMLAEARKNCDRLNLFSIDLLHFDQIDSLAPASFDLIHSCLVFQHIPVKRGEAIFRKLISLVAPGGVGAIHFTFSDTKPLTHRGLSYLRKRFDLINKLFNLAKLNAASAPLMQMNNYSLNRLFDILIETGCSNLHVELLIDDVHHGAFLLFKKTSVLPS